MHALDLERLAAGRSSAQEPDVVVRAFALAREGEQRAVRRPGGARRLRGRAGIAERRRRAVARREPDLGVAPVLVLDHGRHDERDAATVGCELRVADDRQPIVVRGLPGTPLLALEQLGNQEGAEGKSMFQTHTCLDRSGGVQKYRGPEQSACPGPRKPSVVWRLVQLVQLDAPVLRPSLRRVIGGDVS